MKSWNCKTKQMVETPENIKEFLNEIEILCKRYNLSISHEDSHGAFQIEKYNELNIEWLKNAHII